jgi:hypothetical protein
METNLCVPKPACAGKLRDQCLAEACERAANARRTRVSRTYLRRQGFGTQAGSAGCSSI